jgi:hypothetical protein
MFSYRKSDMRIDLTLMKDHFQSEEEKDDFLEWFLCALDKTEKINVLRQIRVCPICNEYVTLKSTGALIVSCEYRIPGEHLDVVINSFILHYISVHNLIPDKIVIETLEKIKPRR